MDPVSQTLAQQTSGSAEGQGFGQFYIQGAQLGMERKRINLAQQRLELEKQQEARAKRHDDLIDPLHASLLNAQATSAGAIAQSNVIKASNEAYANAHLADIFALENQFLQAPDGFLSKEGYAAMMQLSSRDSRLFAEGTPGRQLKDRVDGAIMLQKQFAQRLPDLIDANEKLKASGTYLRGFNQFGPELGIRPDPSVVENQRIRLDQAKQRLEQQAQDMLRKKDAQGLARIRVQLDAVKTRQSALENGFSIEGLPDLPAELFNPALQQQAQPTMQPTPATVPPVDALAPSTITQPNGTNITTIPTANGPTLTRVERPPTTGTTTDLQKQSIAADTSLRELTNIKDEIIKHPEAFGPVGVANKWAEFAHGLFNPKADATVNRIRQKAGQTFITIARSLRPDSGNMSHFELDRLRELGDLTAVENVPSIALSKADELISLQVAKKLRMSKALKEPVSDMVLRAIAPDDIKGLFDDGLLSPADTVKAVNMLPPAQSKALLESLKGGR